ncbi:MAG: response regulator [bacterium]
MNNNIHILIVDDEKIALKNLEHVMKKEGYEITGTQSGQNALNLLEEHQFDIVLTDLQPLNEKGDSYHI